MTSTTSSFHTGATDRRVNDEGAPTIDGCQPGDFETDLAASLISIPSALERSEVPRYFRQFQNAAVLKKLAHKGNGPLYQIIGKKAWYETADIAAWLDSRKRSGPPRIQAAPEPPQPVKPKDRRGRPSKATLWHRAQRLKGES